MPHLSTATSLRKRVGAKEYEWSVTSAPIPKGQQLVWIRASRELLERMVEEGKIPDYVIFVLPPKSLKREKGKLKGEEEILMRMHLGEPFTMIEERGADEYLIIYDEYERYETRCPFCGWEGGVSFTSYEGSSSYCPKCRARALRELPPRGNPVPHAGR